MSGECNELASYIFVHEFLDRRLDNVNGAEGVFLTSSPPPLVNRDVRLLPGSWFTYRLERPRSEVIGLDVSYRVLAPASAAGATLPLLTVPGAFAMTLRFPDPLVSEVVDGDLRFHADLVVKIGGSGVIFEALRIPYRFAIELRVGWHTSGQLHVWTDGALQAYQPGMLPGGRLTVGEFSCGEVGSSPAGRPRWFVDRLTLRALDEADAVDSVVGDIPFDDLDDLDDGERCRVEAIRHAHRVVDLYRALMREFIAVTTQPWQRSVSPSGSAFHEPAVRAHAEATDAFLALMTFFREDDETARAAFLEHLHSFLSELHAQLPQSFAQLLDDLEKLAPPLQTCLDRAEAALADQGPTIEMLTALADETISTAHAIAGGDGG